MRPRVSIGQLIGVVAFCGVGFAALRLASPLVASGLFSLAVLALATGLLRGIARRDMGWIGFGIFGMAYLLFSLGGSPPLITGYLMELLAPTVPGFAPGWTFYTPYSSVSGPDASRLHVVHSLFAIALGLVGALLGRSFAAGREAVR